MDYSAARDFSCNRLRHMHSGYCLYQGNQDPEPSATPVSAKQQSAELYIGDRMVVCTIDEVQVFAKSNFSGREEQRGEIGGVGKARSQNLEFQRELRDLNFISIRLDCTHSSLYKLVNTFAVDLDL